MAGGRTAARRRRIAGRIPAPSWRTGPGGMLVPTPQGALRLHRRHQRPGLRRPGHIGRRPGSGGRLGQDRSGALQSDQQLGAARDRRVPARPGQTRAQELPVASMPVDFTPQRHLHGLPQAAPGRRRLRCGHGAARRALRPHMPASPTRTRRARPSVAKMVGPLADGMPLIARPDLARRAGIDGPFRRTALKTARGRADAADESSSTPRSTAAASTTATTAIRTG